MAKQELYDEFVDGITEALSVNELPPLQFINEDSLDEASEKLVDGVNVIARLVGPSFIVEGKSDNKRFYSKKLWENAIAKTKKIVENSQMVGTIGHKQPIDDQAILEGKITHRVNRLWIDESKNIGMGEFLIMGTDSGRNLNTMLRSGVKIAVSSRAFGDFKGKTKDGADIVDENQYELQTFDFVRTPGVSSAYPVLVESHEVEEGTAEVAEEIIPKVIPVVPPPSVQQVTATNVNPPVSNTIYEVRKMSDNDNTNKMLEKVYEEKAALTAQIKELSSVNEELRVKVMMQEENINLHRDQLAQYESLGTIEDIATVLTKFEQMNESQGSIFEELESYRKAGTPKDIDESREYIVDITEELAQYKALGTVSELREALEANEETARYLEDLGSFEQIAEAFDRSTEKLSAYRELGTFDEIKEVFDRTEESIMGYAALGTPEDIAEAFDEMEEVLVEIQEQRMEEELSAFVSKYNVERDIAEELVSIHGSDKAGQLIESLVSGSKVSRRYSLDEDAGYQTIDDTGSVMAKTRLQKLSENFSR